MNLFYKNLVKITVFLFWNISLANAISNNVMLWLIEKHKKAN